MWEKLSLNVKLSILAGETLVDGHLLTENDELMEMIRRGDSKEACIAFINQNS